MVVMFYRIALSCASSDGCPYDLCVTVIFIFVAHVIVILVDAEYR